MRVLFFIYSLEGGGAERVAASLANYWSAMGWEVTIVTLLPQRLDFYELHPHVRRISLDLASEGRNAFTGLWNNVRRILTLRQVLKRVKPDVAMAMMTTANVLLALAAWRIPNMLAIGTEHVHPPRFPAGTVWELMRRWTYSRLSAVAALTENTKTWLQSDTRASRIAVIPNGVEWPLPVHAPVLTPQSMVTEQKHVMLGVGRLVAQKGFDWLIDAFATLSTKYPDWVLVILGEGPARKALELQIEERRMTEHILLPGRVGNVGQWYSYADLYVFSSRFEGFGNTLVEALAYGLPAVSFDCETGPRDIIRDGIDGLLVPAGDVLALTAALERLMSDEALRNNFAERACEARERFSMGRIAGMWESLFVELRSKLC